MTAQGTCGRNVEGNGPGLPVIIKEKPKAIFCVSSAFECGIHLKQKTVADQEKHAQKAAELWLTDVHQT